jgi:hypothetical protein
MMEANNIIIVVVATAPAVSDVDVRWRIKFFSLNEFFMRK